MKRLFALIMFFAGMQPMSANAQEFMLAAGVDAVAPGSQVEVSIWATNETPSNITVPPEISGSLTQEGPFKVFSVVLRSGKATTISPGGYQKMVYSLTVPEQAQSGFLGLALEDYAAAPVVVRVNAQPSQSLAHDLTVVGNSENGAASSDGNGVLDGVTPYKPIYFLFGTGPFDAKFQISLKYQLFNPDGDWAKKQHWLSHWYLGYTQTAFWDLAAESKPFEDTNFMPEVFYRVENWRPSFLPDDGALDVQTGLMHESNGKGGDDSRSLNILYARATYKHSLGDDWFFRLTGDAWRYVGSLKDNPDIKKFRGHSSLGLTVGTEKGIQFTSYRRGRIGGNKGSYLFDLSIPVKRIGREKNFNFKLHGQLFTGYGENLITYDQKETRFRLGLGIYR